MFPPARPKMAMHMVDRRGFKLLSPLCRPDGITMQSAHEICMVGRCWVKGYSVPITYTGLCRLNIA